MANTSRPWADADGNVKNLALDGVPDAEAATLLPAMKLFLGADGTGALVSETSPAPAALTDEAIDDLAAAIAAEMGP